MEGSGDEEPGADGPLQRLVKRQRKEKRELQGEGRRGPAKGGWGRGERSLRRPPRRGWGGGGGGETRGGPGPVRRSQPGTWRGDAPRRRSWKPRREKLGGSGGGAFGSAGLWAGREQPLRCLRQGTGMSGTRARRLGGGATAGLRSRARWFSPRRRRAEPASL